MVSKSLYFFPFILISLLPAFLVSGPFLADLSVVILNFFFFYIVFKEKKFEIFKNKFFLFFASFCIYLIIRSLFTEVLEVSLKSAVFYFRFIIFSLMIYLTIKNYPHFFEKFSIIFLITINFILIDSIVQFFVGVDILGLSSGHKYRISGPFGDELILGSYLSRFSPFLIFFLHYVKKPFNYLFLVTFFLGFIVTLLSAERTGSIFYIISILFFLISSKNFLKIKILFLIVTIISTFLILNVDKTKKRLITQAIQNSQDGTLWFSVMHDAHLRTAYKMFEQNPIFGVGPKMFRYECSKKKYEIENPPNSRSNEFRCSTHPHNLLLQLMAETGLIGLVFYLLIFSYVLINFLKYFYKLLKNKNHGTTNYEVFFLLSFFLTLWPIAPSGNIFNNWLSIIFFYPLGFYLYLSEVNK